MGNLELHKGKRKNEAETVFEKTLANNLPNLRIPAKPNWTNANKKNT